MVCGAPWPHIQGDGRAPAVARLVVGPCELGPCGGTDQPGLSGSPSRRRSCVGARFAHGLSIGAWNGPIRCHTFGSRLRTLLGAIRSVLNARIIQRGPNMQQGTSMTDMHFDQLEPAMKLCLILLAISRKLQGHNDSGHSLGRIDPSLRVGSVAFPARLCHRHGDVGFYHRHYLPASTACVAS